MEQKIDGYQTLELPLIKDERGSLSFIEYGKLLNFTVKRVYWLHNLHQARGGHAHKNLKQFMFISHGSLDITIDDGKIKEKITLNSPNQGLCIYKPLWRIIDNFINNPTLIVLCSNLYDDNDYIRSYDEFKIYKNQCN